MRPGEVEAATLAGLPVGILLLEAGAPHRRILCNDWLAARIAGLADAPDLAAVERCLEGVFVIDGDPVPPAELPLRRALDAGAARGLSIAELQRDGRRSSWVALDAGPVCVGSGPPRAWNLTVREVPPPAESALFPGAMARRTFDAAPLGLLVTRADGHVLAMNARYRRIIGLPPSMSSETLQHNIAALDLYREAGLQPYIDGLLRGEPFERELRLTSLVGEDVWVNYAGVPVRDDVGAVIGALIVLQDVASQRSLERRARQAEAMEATARLAGGVAHDINNTMTAVAGYAELLLAQETDGRKRRYLAQIADAAGQVTHVVSMLGQLRQGSPQTTQTLDVAEVVWATASDFASRAPQDVEVVVDVAADALPARVSREQLASSVRHILRNAVTAMPRGGTLRVEVSAGTPPHSLRQQFPSLPDARCARIQVTDTGVGIAPERLHRIFEPYSSSHGASAEKGVGLGLALVYAFVQESQGGIVVRSRLGHGTRVELTLPLAFPVR
ncbi:MAG: PAS domain-containing protein [Deltaproteobacteria bacterium]|nr:PAS domain-containing protein [Deltaproteobacteria bacterium]MCB9788275.1 PAS domain-containing protein [Deltaproteobacteria bacterium]